MTFRPTIRLRLTLLYGGLFLAAGAVLLTLNYALVRRGLENQGLGVRFEAPLPAEGLGPQPIIGELATEQIIGPNGRNVEDVLRDYQGRLRDQALHQLVIQSGLALGVMALASVGLGWMVAGRALRPLQQVTGTARRLSKDNLHERLALQGPQDELKELADTFDAMLERLESAFESQKRFVANASHELRTPLAIQRTLVDVALADPDASHEDLRAMAVGVRDAVDRTEQIIDGLLILARSEQGQLLRDEVDLGVVARGAVEAARGEAAAAGLSVEERLPSVIVRGNPVLLERLVVNLMQNAVRHNRPGGWLEMETSAASGCATVRVANSGRLIDAGQVDALFEPFRRLAPERTESYRGVGLGLSIVQAVAHAHSGTVQARPLPEGGLEVVVELPTGGNSDAPPAQDELAMSSATSLRICGNIE
jgi:signal transduction histidine kinase